jgi:hypothetical protein
MLKVFTAQHHAEAHFVQGLLQADGLAAEVRGEALFTTLEAAAVIPGAQPEVWLLDPSRAPQAREIIQRYSQGEAGPVSEEPSWPCPVCDEIHEPQFTACWNCGTAKPDSTAV